MFWDKHIVRTIIIGTNDQKRIRTAKRRAFFGGLFMDFPTGLLFGIPDAKRTTFKVIYNDGSEKKITVKNSSSEYDRLCSYLNK